MENKYSIFKLGFTPIIAISLLTVPASAEPDGDDEQQKDKEQSVLPALRVLPAGSVLKGVRIPRYNADFTPASLLTAEALKVVSKKHLKGTNVELTLYDKNGDIKADTHLNSVDYNQATEIIRSSENLVFSGAEFKTTSQGLILDWKNQRGFFLGKNQTIIYLKKPISMKDKNNTSNVIIPKALTSSAKSATALIAAASLASAPTFLSAKDLAEFDQLSKPSTQQVEKLTHQVTAEITEAKHIANITDQQKAQLVQAIEKAEKDEKVIEQPPAEQAIPAELKPEKGKDHFSIKSLGDMFFDANKGVMVFSKKVEVTHPEYRFSCDGEVKVVLAPKPIDKKLTDVEKAKLKPNDKFGDVSKIIANDNVLVVGKDKKGNPISARAGSLIYDHKTGAIILRGLNSRITMPDKQIKIVSKNGHIRIDKNFHVTAKGSQIDLNLGKLKNNGR